MKHKIAIAVCIILIVLTVGFIWNNSRKSEELSTNQSKAVASKVEQIVTSDGNKNTSSFFDTALNKIRKAAHAIEFFVLGIEITAFAFVISKKFKPQTLWNILSSALAVAVVDESIQILSGRGPKVQDVLLDFCGALAGFLLTLLIEFIISSCKKGRRKYGKT